MTESDPKRSLGAGVAVILWRGGLNSVISKIDAFFEYIPTIDDGKRLIAKIKDDGTAFSQDEIYIDFSKIYRKYIIINKDLGDFFKRETKDSLTQLCDDFERTIIKIYPIIDEDNNLSMAAES